MLTIRRFHTRYRTFASASSQELAQRRLDDLARARLPALVGQWLQATPGDAGAVYRIRRLKLRLVLSVERLPEEEIAARWARLLVRSVVHAILYGSSDNVVRFEDTAHYLAAFFLDLRAGRAWSDWVYAEFQPLQDLPLGRVFALLLGARPQLLLPVAAVLQERAALEPIIAALTRDDVYVIWERGLGFNGLVAHPPDANLLSELLSHVPSSLPLEPGSAAAFERNRLRIYLAMALQNPQGATIPVAGVIASHLAAIHWLYTARPRFWLWQAIAQQEIDSPRAIASLLGELTGELAPVGDWLALQLSSGPRRQALAQLVKAIVPGAAETTPTTPGVTSVQSLFAGLALLLPEVRAHGLYERAGAAGVYQLLLDAIGPTYRPLAWGDTGVMALVGLTPMQAEAARRQTVDWPPLPSLPEVDPALPWLGWTQVVLRAFVRGLRGFETSSPGFIADRFLNQPGRVVLDDGQVDVYLARAPLGIALQMAGRTGEQGAIPWLNGRSLTIHLPEG